MNILRERHDFHFNDLLTKSLPFYSCAIFLGKENIGIAFQVCKLERLTSKLIYLIFSFKAKEHVVVFENRSKLHELQISPTDDTVTF